MNAKENNWMNAMKASYKSSGHSALSFTEEVLHLTDNHHALSAWLRKHNFNQPTLKKKLEAFYCSEEKIKEVV